MILSSSLLVAASLVLLPQDGEEGGAGDPAQVLREARRAFATEEGAEARMEALRTMAQVALGDSARLVGEARKGLVDGLDDPDFAVAAEAMRLVVVADEAAAAERELASRLKVCVRTLRKFMAEVEHRKKTRNLGFLAGFPELEGDRRLRGYPGHVEALARALGEVPGDRAVDALGELMGLDLGAQSADLVLAATDSLLKQDPADGVEVVVDWLRRHRKALPASLPPEDTPADTPEDRKQKKARLRELQDERFGRLKSLRGFRDAFPPVDEACSVDVLRRLGEWARARKVASPPAEGEDADWKAWLKTAQAAAD